MKKQFYLLPIMLFFTAFIFSCNQEDVPKASKPDTGLLVFTDRNSFDKVASNSEKDFTSFRSDNNFVSLRQSLATNNARNEKEDLGIDNDFLLDILNADGIVQIGNYIFKVNMSTKTVTALHVKNKNLIEKLKKNEKHADIYTFSTDDDVLDLLDAGITKSPTLEAGSNQRVQLFCGQDGVSQGWKDIAQTPRFSQRVYIVGGWTYETGYGFARVGYNKAGIYFELRLQTGSTFSNGNPMRWKAREYWFKPKCRDERYLKDSGYVNQDNDTRNPNATSGYWDNDKIYGSTTALNKYHAILTVVFFDGQTELTSATEDSNHGY